MRNIQAGNFSVATMGGDAAPDPDPNIYEFYRSEEVWTHNYARYKNPRVDQLLDEGRVMMDPKKRHRIYREVTEILFDEVPTIWTVLAPVFFTYRSYVRGFEVEPQGLFFSGKKGIPMIWLDR
jgi:peptide/nickel transport system substrate-binding protein